MPPAVGWMLNVALLAAALLLLASFL